MDVGVTQLIRPTPQQLAGKAKICKDNAAIKLLEGGITELKKFQAKI